MRSATARTVDAETTRRPARGQEDGVNETSVVTEFRWIEAGGGLEAVLAAAPPREPRRETAAR